MDSPCVIGILPVNISLQPREMQLMAMVPTEYLEAALPVLEQGYPVLTPNLRLARALRVDASHRLYRYQKVVVSPPVDALGAWIEKHWRRQVEAGLFTPARVLSAAEAEEIWLEVIEADLEDSREFTLLQPRAAAKAAQHCRDALLQHRAPLAELLPRFQQDADCARFSTWLARFQTRLEEAGWLTIADVETQMAAAAEPVVARVLVLDSETISPVSRAAVTRLASEVIWLEPVEAPRAVTGTGYETARDEQRAAARWAADRYRAGDGSTAIVALNLSEHRQAIEIALREAFDALDARYDVLPVNFSRGIPFSEAPLYRDAILALRLLDDEIRRADLLAAVRSPYLLGLRAADSTRALTLVRALFRLAVEPIPADEFRAQLRHHDGFPLTDLLDRVASERLLQGKKPAHEWRALWVELLAAWGWPARAGVDSFEHQQIERFAEMLDQFEAAGDLLGAMDSKRALSLLRRILERRQFQPSTPADAIQVLSEREVRGLHFDAVWVLGAQSTHLPRRMELLPFVPASIQRELRMPTTVDPEGLQVARRLISGLVQHCNEVIVTWHKHVDGVEQLPSPLLSEVVTATAPVPGTIDRWLASGVTPADMEMLTDTEAGALEAASNEVTGGVGLLRDQSQCPFRAWVNHRLGVRALDEPAVGLTSRERGELLHLSLKLFWLVCGDSRTLKGLSDQALDSRIDQVVGEAVTALPPRVQRRVGGTCLDIERERLHERLRAWLHFERNREVAFSVIACESERSLPVGGLTLDVEIDRIDALEDGRQVVLDYKSSDRFSARDWWGERIREPQLPGYALLDDAVAGIGWGMVSAKGVKAVTAGEGLGFGKSDNLARQLGDDNISDWAEVRTQWRTQLDGLAEEFLAGDASITPMKRACQFCHYKPVCRIDWGLAADEEAEP